MDSVAKTNKESELSNTNNPIRDSNDDDNNNSGAQAILDSDNINSKEAEDRERHARDLKAGLHPLKVLVIYWF